jgi:hypothetical protein
MELQISKPFSQDPVTGTCPAPFLAEVIHLPWRIVMDSSCWEGEGGVDRLSIRRTLTWNFHVACIRCMTVLLTYMFFAHSPWNDTIIRSVCPAFHLQNLTNKSNDILSWAVHAGSLPTSVILIYIRAYNIAYEQETNIILLVIIIYCFIIYIIICVLFYNIIFETYRFHFKTPSI